MATKSDLPWPLLLRLVIGARSRDAHGAAPPVDFGMLGDWLLADIGDRIDRTNALVEHPPEDVRLEIEGYTETIRHRGWAVQLNAEPYDPWQIGLLAGVGDAGDDLGRLAGDDNAAIRAAITSTDTSIAFDPNAFRWTIYAGLVLAGVTGSYASTPDTGVLDITGDVDLRADVTLANWNTGVFRTLVAKYTTAGNQKSYGLGVNNVGQLAMFWSNDGSTDLELDCATLPTPGPGGRLAVRATLDVVNGANKTATFYTAPTIDGPWVQLGAAVTTAGNTSIFSSSAVLEVGSIDAGNFVLSGTIHAAQVRSSIDGTVVANPNFAQAMGTRSFTDSAGLVWTLNAAALIDSDFPLDVRLGGELATVSGIATTPATFVAAGTVAHANNASVTPSLPAGVAANDLLIIFAAIRNSGTGTPVAPTGYTRLPIFGSTDNAQVFAKVHSGTESDPTVTFNSGVANADTSAQMCAFRSMPISLPDLADIVLAPANTQLNASAQNVAVPALSLKPYPGQVVLAFGWKQDDWTSVTSPTGFTEIGEPDTTTGDDQGITWGYRIDTTPAVVSDASFTVTGGAAAISRSAVAALAAGFQTMTVSARSVNGVVKSHAAGTLIEVADPLIAGL